MTTIKLDIWTIAEEYTKRIAIWINKALPVLLNELKRLTPEDTWNMLNSYEVVKAKREWGVVSWSISNWADYAIYVEYWVGWLKFTYHKPKWTPFYHWIGNRTFARAVDITRDEITKIIYNEINR